MPPRPHLSIPVPGSRRAVVVGAGSFGTAVAVLLARGGFRTTLQTRTPQQAAELTAARANERYLPGVPLPDELRIEAAELGLGRADYVFLGVPSNGLDEVIANLRPADSSVCPSASNSSRLRSLVVRPCWSRAAASPNGRPDAHIASKRAVNPATTPGVLISSAPARGSAGSIGTSAVR